MTTNRILMLLDSSFPPDIRVEKEIIALEAAGYKVTVLARGDADSKTRDTWNGAEVLRIPRFQEGGLRSRLHNLDLLLRQQSAIWRHEISLAAKRIKPLAIHVHDLPLVRTALDAAEGPAIPVIADLHENYPAAVREWWRLDSGLEARVRRMFDTYDRWFRQERYCVDRVAHVIAVVDEMKERMIAAHSLDPSRITVVTNTERRSFVDQASEDRELIQQYTGYFSLLYIGGFGPHRGLDTAVRGCALARETVPNLRLLLVGRGSPSYEARLRGLISEHRLDDVVEIVGWQPFDRVFSYMVACSVGIIPHNSNEHTDNTIPHKLFQYMMTGTPVLVSTCKPLDRVVQAIGSGISFKADDPASFAEQLTWAYANQAALREMGTRGKAATRDGEWNWETTSRALVDLYSSLASDFCEEKDSTES